ncbi:cyclic nucleotide-binding domain-containing protein [Sphingobacterium sp. DK4209]|uniref:Cyclic nucleotide-binding domain-containing protein n=1 Tax=Sphingobacterium zhuxiongii TaxID=2662364 RepID=A0A5Q0QAG7_9SPHI|nr:MULTISPECIES: cyclic nucleotide-binding domain-containing protein [unclassified Sphingobacterium]MVZ64563.1 cyclic nucleotide-binding domain-containing protein [Sphingobacterium sp. DK4209]QGA25891.1 cyclic nucleotide-binding domain-containing protein [Sphingobacterium sp. dk4302]
MTIEQVINNFYELPPESLELLLSQMDRVTYPKGYILLESDRLERKVFFLTKGSVRAYSPQPDQNITFWFGLEGDIVLSMRSYVENLKSYEDIELMEDSTLYAIGMETLKSLYQKDIHIANLGRVIVEGELLKMERRWISSQLKSAKERYEELLMESPALLQRIPLKYIASFLRMTPVSLSRIRKEK